MEQAKVAFVCFPNLTTFINPIVDHIIENTDLIVRKTYSNDPQTVKAAIEWADVVWLEWANELAISCTTQLSELLVQKKVIVRAHSYEVLGGYIPNMNWRPVDKVVFVAKHVESLARSQLPKDVESVVIPNGLDTEKFVMGDDERQSSFCFLGHMSAKKGPMLLAHTIHYLSQEFSRDNPTFHIGGKWQDSRFELYLKYWLAEAGLIDSVTFYGEIENPKDWYQDKYAILCTSPWESQNLSVMEAMLCGCMPLVHNFPGSRDIYDPRYVWTTFDDLGGMLKAWNGNRQEYRDFVQEKYNLVDTTQRIVDLIYGV